MNAVTSAPRQALSVHLRAWRKSRNFTLEMLAERIGSKVSTISGWETGRRAVGVEDLVKLGAAYDIHPAALLLSPDDGTAKVSRMQVASTLVERMPADAAEEWLAIGRRIAAA